MLLNLTWLIPGLPIIASLLTALLLVSFGRTINRLTKPVSYFLISSTIISLLLSFLLFKQHVNGTVSIFGNLPILDQKLNFYVDNSALFSSLILGFISLLLMLISFLSLERRNGYVRYFVLLGLFSGAVFAFSFSGNSFHALFDPLLPSFENLGLSLV